MVAFRHLRREYAPSGQAMRLLFSAGSITPAGSHLSIKRYTKAHEPMLSPSSAAKGNFDPYNYTSGRWLRRNALERRSRYIRFDFDALRHRVVEICPGASSVISCEKTEGEYNRVFIFHTDNEQNIVARLLFAVAGPPSLRTNSEVATIKYLRSKTSIPIPKILDWSDDPNNAIGSEYIIMEHTLGVSLRDKWMDMDLGARINCIRAIYEKLQEAVDLNFPAYGSSYLTGTPYITAPTLPLEEGFCIGPHCAPRYWGCKPGQAKSDHQDGLHQGLWTDLAAYADGLIDTGKSSIPPDEPRSARPRYGGSTKTHHELLKYGRAIIKATMEHPVVQDTASPLLFHSKMESVLRSTRVVISEIIFRQRTTYLQSCTLSEMMFCYCFSCSDCPPRHFNYSELAIMRSRTYLRDDSPPTSGHSSVHADSRTDVNSSRPTPR
ncbi:hypothetical protein T440DRAFT_449071 [Plenodomus tracheiphilus IPT5]|uniref:Altered inheritance of mitochondria protein 9, mitochondrial n=1 Tax=Plenodomus tracheiphilus IPT5 TaxID=1408161 RepID=A0A6A7B9U7_9PLEO|nr:hypothetical protein T440DRAFT_449071 [Plenodomus tracheiphilus IPT5]